MAEIRMLNASAGEPTSQKSRRPRPPTIHRIAMPVAGLAFDASIELQGIIELLQREFDSFEATGLECVAWTGLMTRATVLNGWIGRALNEPAGIDVDEMRGDVLSPIAARRASEKGERG